jgi:hypothetical protein
MDRVWPRKLAVGATAVMLAVSIAGCTSDAKHAAKASSSVTKPTLTPPSSSTPSAPSAPPSTVARTLAGDCSTILPLDQVETALGKPVVGHTAFVVNIPDAKIGLVARVNCRYGIGTSVKKGTRTIVPPPKVEVSVSLYSTDKQAADRVAGTVAVWRDNGARQIDVLVGPDDGTLLIGYGEPLLVVAHGQRTAAVSVQGTLLVGKDIGAVTGKIAATAITNSGG